MSLSLHQKTFTATKPSSEPRRGRPDESPRKLTTRKKIDDCNSQAERTGGGRVAPLPTFDREHRFDKGTAGQNSL